MLTRKILCIAIFTLLLQSNGVIAGSTDSENLKKTGSETGSAGECFEGASRVIFKFNHALDGAVYKPISKGYRSLPAVLRKGTGNAVNNLRSLLTFSNNILQGDFGRAGNTAGRFAINSTVGILGIFDPASAFGFEKEGREDFGQTLGIWGAKSGCYFVLPFLGPTTARDAIGLVGNSLLDPVYQITHNSEVYDRSFSEHNFWYYKGTGAVDFRSKNIESFESVEKNSIDLYASVKSLYLQNRDRKINNSKSTDETQDNSDWEEIDIN